MNLIKILINNYKGRVHTAGKRGSESLISTSPLGLGQKIKEDNAGMKEDRHIDDEKHEKIAQINDYVDISQLRLERIQLLKNKRVTIAQMNKKRRF